MNKYEFIEKIVTKDLKVVETTSERNGYPRFVEPAIIGFKTFKEAEQFAEQNKMYLVYLEKNSGQQLWTRGNSASGPLDYSRDDSFWNMAEVGVLTYPYNHEVAQESLEQGFLTNETITAWQNIDDDHYVLYASYDGSFIEVIEERPMYICEDWRDGRLLTIGAIPDDIIE